MNHPAGPSQSRTLATLAAHGPPEVRIEIKSNPVLLAGVREMLASIAKRLGFSEEAGGQIALAVDEALCNVIRHGYGRASDRPIWLSLWPLGGDWAQPVPTDGPACCRYPEALQIVIEDEAPQVDPACIKSRDLDEIRPGGLGVHIIKSVMDQATYERRPTAGMRLTMVKKRVGSVGDRGAEPATPSSPCSAGPGSCCPSHADRQKRAG